MNQHHSNQEKKRYDVVFIFPINPKLTIIIQGSGGSMHTKRVEKPHQTPIDVHVRY